MASGKEIEAGKAFIRLFTKDGELVKGLNRAQARLKAFSAGMQSIGTKMVAVGAAITAPLLLAAHAAAESGAAIYDMSRRTGLSVEALSRLGYAADRSGTDIGTVEGAIRKMQKTISGVKDDVEGTTGSLEFLGLTAADVKGKLPEEQFSTIAARIAAIADPSERAAAAMKVFGRSGTSLLPLIENLATLRERQERLGLVKSGQSAKDMKEFEDVMQDAGALVKSVWESMAKAILPILKEKTERLIQITKTIRDWTRENKGLIATVFKVGTAIGIAGIAIAAFGKAISLVAPVLGLVGSALGAMVATVSAILTPIGIVGLAIVGLAGHFLFFTESGNKMLARLMGNFDDLKSVVTKAVGAMADALAAGDIKLAAQILWVGLQAAWVSGTLALQAKWIEFKTAFVQTAAAAFYGALEIWTNVKAALLETTINLVSAMTGAWDTFTTKFEGGFNSAANSAIKAFYKVKGAMDSTFDADTVNRAVDETFKRAAEGRDKGAADRANEREVTRKAEVDTVRSAQTASLNDIEERGRSLHEGADAQGKKELADLKAQDADLRKQLEALRKKAAYEKYRSKRGDPFDEFANPDEDVFPVDEVKDSVEATRKTVSARGTFNAAAVAGLTTSQIPQQQLDEQKKASKFLKNIDRKLPAAFV